MLTSYLCVVGLNIIIFFDLKCYYAFGFFTLLHIFCVLLCARFEICTWINDKLLLASNNSDNNNIANNNTSAYLVCLPVRCWFRMHIDFFGLKRCYTFVFYTLLHIFMYC